VRKPSKQHRVDCFASKLHSSVVARLNCSITRENVDWNTRNTCCMQINWPQQRRRIVAAEQLAATARKRIVYIYIEQCSNVQTPKTEKTCEKVCTQHRTRTRVSKPSVRVNWRLYSAADVTRLARARVRLTADGKWSTLVNTVYLEVLLLLD